MALSHLGTTCVKDVHSTY